MPRRAREKSNTGIYHVMVRGINRQVIFNDEKDKQIFVSRLMKYKEISGYEIYGYCLMDNHIHLLLSEGKETIGEAMKRIGASYVYWYNLKYDRCGHLFQDRFKSENIEDDKYLMAVLRYIHQNPIKAGMVEAMDAYRWSSYNDYLSKNPGVTDTQFFLNLLNPDPKIAVEMFINIMTLENQDIFLDDEAKRIKMLTDEDAKALIKKITGSNNPQVLTTLNKKDRDSIIRILRAKHISIRQMARLTGMGRRIIEKAMIYSD